MRAAWVLTVSSLIGLAGCAEMAVPQSYEACPTTDGPRGARLAIVPELDIEMADLGRRITDAFNIPEPRGDERIQEGPDGGLVITYGSPGDIVWAQGRSVDGHVVTLDIFHANRTYRDDPSLARDALEQAVDELDLDSFGTLGKTGFPMVFEGIYPGGGRIRIDDMHPSEVTGYKFEAFVVPPPRTVPTEETGPLAQRAAMCAVAGAGAFTLAGGVVMDRMYEAVTAGRMLERVYEFHLSGDCRTDITVRIDARSGILSDVALDPLCPDPPDDDGV